MFVCFRFIKIEIEIYLNVTQNLCYFMSPLIWVLGYTYMWNVIEPNFLGNVTTCNDFYHFMGFQLVFDRGWQINYTRICIRDLFSLSVSRKITSFHCLSRCYTVQYVLTNHRDTQLHTLNFPQRISIITIATLCILNAIIAVSITRTYRFLYHVNIDQCHRPVFCLNPDDIQLCCIYILIKGVAYYHSASVVIRSYQFLSLFIPILISHKYWDIDRKNLLRLLMYRCLSRSHQGLYRIQKGKHYRN